MIQPEPPPQPNDHPHVWPHAIAWADAQDVSAAARDLMTARHVQGVEKYGVPLQPHNGRDPLVDLVQELLDGIAYAMQAVLETPSETSRRRVMMDIMTRQLQALETVLATIADPAALDHTPMERLRR